MILFVDNYDSFTYNLVSMMGVLEPRLEVVRNDAVTVAEVLAMDLDVEGQIAVAGVFERTGPCGKAGAGQH